MNAQPILERAYVMSGMRGAMEGVSPAKRATLVGRVVALLASRRLPLVAALLSMLLMAPSLFAGLMMDDYGQRALFLSRPLVPTPGLAFNHMFDFSNGDPEQNRVLMDVGAVPWWTLDTIRQVFWRPLTGLTHALDYRLWPDSPFLMHAHSLLWLGALVLCLSRLYGRMLAPAWAAGLATLLWALDDAHAMPAGWIANRNELISGVFAVLALERYVAWRRGSRPATASVAVGLFAAALFSKESALAITPYLFGYAVFVERGSLLPRMASLVPFGLIVLVWRVIYVQLGSGTFGMASYVDPVSEPLAFAGAVVERLPILLLAQLAVPPSDLTLFMTEQGIRWLWWLAMLLLSLVVGILLPMLKRDREARFWAFGMLFALLPACSTFMTDRMLLFSGIGAMALFAQLVRAAGSRVLVAAILVLQVVVPVPVTQARIGGIAAYAAPMQSAQEVLDDVPNLASKTVVLVNAPNVLQATYVPLTRRAMGDLVPAHTYTLAPDTGLPIPIVYARTGARTLEVSPSQPFAWSLFRDYDHPFHAGDVVVLGGMEARIQAATDRGEPTRVAYVFSEALESDRFVWLRYVDGEYKRFTPPALGQTVQLP